MFKNYLQTQAAAYQLVVFLTLWVGCFLIFSFLQPLIVQWTLGYRPEDMAAFMQQEFLTNPDLVAYVNFAGALTIFLIPAGLFVYLASPRPFRYLGLERPAGRQWLLVCLLVLGLIPVLSISGGWINELELGAGARDLRERREAIFNQYFSQAGWVDLVRNLFFLALVPALAEELLFRGVLQRFLHTWFKKAWITVLVSGLLFSLMHSSVYEFLPIWFAGLILALVYQLTGKLWLSVLLHFLNNGVQVVLLYFLSKNDAAASWESPAWLGLLVFLMALAWLYIAMKRLAAASRPLPDNWSVVAQSPDDKLT